MEQLQSALSALEADVKKWKAPESFALNDLQQGIQDLQKTEDTIKVIILAPPFQGEPIS